MDELKRELVDTLRHALNGVLALLSACAVAAGGVLLLLCYLFSFFGPVLAVTEYHNGSPLASSLITLAWLISAALIWPKITGPNNKVKELSWSQTVAYVCESFVQTLARWALYVVPAFVVLALWERSFYEAALAVIVLLMARELRKQNVQKQQNNNSR